MIWYSLLLWPLSGLLSNLFWTWDIFGYFLYRDLDWWVGWFLLSLLLGPFAFFTGWIDYKHRSRIIDELIREQEESGRGLT
jgi:hypothetical protein